MTATQLVVVLGRPGTGKTVLASELAKSMRGAHLRVDSVEWALTGATLPEGDTAYAVVREVARHNLHLGIPVIADAVSPTRSNRIEWTRLAQETGAALTIFETFVPNVEILKARIEAREPEHEGEHVPTWEECRNQRYDAWDDHLDGRRYPVDMTETGHGVWTAVQHINWFPTAVGA
ncbi:AAA family ATPase [Actinomycetota bacterium]